MLRSGASTERLGEQQAEEATAEYATSGQHQTSSLNPTVCIIEKMRADQLLLLNALHLLYSPSS